MSERAAVSTKSAASTVASSTPQIVLQRQCGCGQHTTAGGECEECKKSRAALRRTSRIPLAPPGAPPSPPPDQSSHFGAKGRSPTTQSSAPRSDFTRIQSLRSEDISHRDGGEDAEVSEMPDAGGIVGQLPRPQIQQERGGNERTTLGLAGLGATALDAGGGTRTSCPQKTAVDKLIGRAAANSSTYRTGFGAVAVMRVDPDSQNWDGTSIVESFGPATSDCPQEFGIHPCSGHTTFTVGSEGHSPIFGTLAATRNRFYDYHETRWRGGSLLHDRNPQGKSSCQIECEQQYSCQGTQIGKHKIKRTFTKGKSGSTDVTLVEVART